jgi:hypothetical protein
MDCLKKDIPKFLNNSPVISSENKQWWGNCFANVNFTYSSTPARVVKIQHGQAVSQIRRYLLNISTYIFDPSIFRLLVQ